VKFTQAVAMDIAASDPDGGLIAGAIVADVLWEAGLLSQ